MLIEWLRVINVRNLADIRIEPGPGINVISGANGSGKSALLEAIHILGSCRSFRTPAVSRVIRYQQGALRVSAGLRMPDQSLIVAGVERSRHSLTLRYDNREVRRVSELAAQMPMIACTPDSRRLVTGGPVHRRRWLNWAMFHVEPGYIEVWREYYKALKYRNNLLKQQQGGLLEPWERAMGQSAQRINRRRQAFLDELTEHLAPVSQHLGIPRLLVEYECGWQKPASLDTILAEHRERDLDRGNTGDGIHRSDLALLGNGRPLGHFYSSGQIKLALIALCLAQGRVFRQRTGRSPILMVDDLPAELDEDSQGRVVRGLATHEGQVFVTTTRGSVAADPGCAEKKMFHVKQGEVGS